VTTPGHSPGHICLVDEERRLIFSGDHVLARISPHIALELPGPTNPFADYYHSLDRIEFEDDMEVCPAHEYRFIGMQRRVAQLVEHNRPRSAEVLKVIAEHRPETVWDTARHLSWSRGWDSLQSVSLRLSISETASHLVYLRSLGHDIEVPVTDSHSEVPDHGQLLPRLIRPVPMKPRHASADFARSTRHSGTHGSLGERAEPQRFINRRLAWHGRHGQIQLSNLYE
jgi:hypothetical protein